MNRQSNAPTAKSITFSMPWEMGRGIEKIAKAEGITFNKLILKAFRQYSGLRAYRRDSAKARKLVKP